MSEVAKGDVPQNAKSKAAGALALVSFAAVACGFCCALPFALPAVALASSGGLLAWFGGAQGLFSIAAVALVLLAWLWIGVNSARSKRRPAVSTLVGMAVATLVLVAGAGVPLVALFV